MEGKALLSILELDLTERFRFQMNITTHEKKSLAGKSALEIATAVKVDMLWGIRVTKLFSILITRPFSAQEPTRKRPVMMSLLLNDKNCQNR